MPKAAAAKKSVKKGAAAPPKKAPTKKGLPATTKAAKAAVVPPESRKQKLLAVMKGINDKWAESRGGSPVVMLASEANCSYLLRRPTGIVDLDIALGGGFPASGLSVIVGPEGVGKDHLIWRTCGVTQKIYGDEFAMAFYFTEFKPDKAQMRAAGLRIRYSEEEIEEFVLQREEKGHPPFTEEEFADLRDQVGEIALIAGVDAETGFNALADFLASNTCQIIGVNSIGFLQTQAKEEKADDFGEFAQRSSEAQLLSKVSPKFAMTMNQLGSKNETAIIFINQVRSKTDQPRPMKGRAVQAKDKYQPAAQIHSMRHGMAIELSLHKGQLALYDEKSKTAGGREIHWELTKGKLGTHDGIKGKYTFLYDSGISEPDNLFATCNHYDIFERGGSWYEFKHPTHGFRCNGEEGVRFRITQMEGLAEILRAECLRASGISFRWK